MSPSRALDGVIALQRDRWILWLPLGMIAGAALWLAAPTDPPSWLGPMLLILGTAVAFGLAMWPGKRRDGAVVALRHTPSAACSR